MSAPSLPSLMPGNRPGGAKAMHGVLGNLPTCAKVGLSSALLACTMGLALPATSAPQGIDLLSSTPAFAKSSSTLPSNEWYVEGGVFTLSISDYAERINDAFKELGQKDYSVSLVKGTDGKTLNMDFTYKSEHVGYAEFRTTGKDKALVLYSQRDSKETFNYARFTFFNDGDQVAEHVVYSSIASIMASGPTCDKYSAHAIVDELIDNLSTITIDSDGRENYLLAQKLAYPFFYTLDIDQSKMTFHMNCS